VLDIGVPPGAFDDPLAILAPQIAAFGFLAIAIVAVLRVHGERPEAPDAA